MFFLCLGKPPRTVFMRTCKLEYANITCPPGYYISILSAMHGRLSSDACGYGDKRSNTSCSLPEATQIAQKR